MDTAAGSDDECRTAGGKNGKAGIEHGEKVGCFDRDDENHGGL
jgi:hypothetical protein